LKQLTVSGIEIAYLDEGKGPAVVIGHCSSASHKEWLPLIEALKSDWRVLAPDFIGYGRSDPWPAEEPFSVDADVNVLLALAKKTKGRFISWAILTARPGARGRAHALGPRVKSLTLVEPVSSSC
jgi:pimeloyl-ACP methyl ester carboxylesterase